MGAPPRLQILHTGTNAGAGFELSWPDDGVGWVLEQAPHLRAPVPWTIIPSDLYEAGPTSLLARVSAAEGGRFFRLRQGGVSLPGLTGYWRLEEGAGGTSDDASGSAVAMMLSNTVWTDGRVGEGALRFNGEPAGGAGSRAWVNNTNHQVLPSTGRPFSISMWLSPDAWRLGWQGLAGQGESNGWRVALHTPGPGTNELIFAAAHTGSLSVTGRTLMLPGQWRHLTVTHDGVQGSVFLDSALLGQGTGTLATDSELIFFGGGVGGLDSFLGRLDDVRVLTNALTLENIALKGRWTFDEGAGDFSSDRGVHGHTARISDPAAWVPGREGAGINLATGQVVIRNEDYGVLPPSGGAFSLSFWLRPESASGDGIGLMSCGEGTSAGWDLVQRSSEPGAAMLHFSSTNRGGTLDLAARVPMTNGVWTRLDLTFNGAVANVYANGRAAGSGIGAIRGTTSPLVVSAALGLTNGSGVLDDLAIHSRERGESEIGPVSRTMWETVLLGGTTNWPLQGTGPAGRTLTYALSPVITPSNGMVTLQPESGIATYQAGTRKGPDAFAYTVSDGEFTTTPTIVGVSVVQPHWLSPTGSGTQDGTAPAHAWPAGPAEALDAIWRTNHYYDCFFYAPGEYETHGWKYIERQTANPGCKHIGTASAGAGRTTLRLVGLWDSYGEESMFATSQPLCNDFEVQHLQIDCNATNMPKYLRGEPVWIRIPLAAPAPVQAVTLRWDNRYAFGYAWWQFGRAAEFSLCARLAGTNTFVTNCSSLTSTGQVDVIAVGALADELFLQMDLRAPGVDHYSLTEIEVAGAEMSLPMAMAPGGGESRLDAVRAAAWLADGNPGTVWASGTNDQVEIVLPLVPGTVVSELDLNWNCQTLAGPIRLGPAAAFTIRARHEGTGQFEEIPSVRHGRTSSGLETVTFGLPGVTNFVTTDRVMLVLMAREATVDRYSLREVTLRAGAARVALRQPTAQTCSPGGACGVFSAFDRNPATAWWSETQGMVGGIAVHGNNLKLIDIDMVGFGTRAGRECYPVFLTSYPNSGPQPSGNVLVEDCRFRNPAHSPRDGLTVLALIGKPSEQVTNTLVRRCTVTGVRSHFSYSHAFNVLHLEDSFVDDCEVGQYFEPDVTWIDTFGPVVVRSNKFYNVDHGVNLLQHPGSHFELLVCVENEITLTTVTGWGFSSCDACIAGPSGTMTNVVLLNNIIRFPDWASAPGRSHGGIHYGDIHHGLFANNVIALGTANHLRVRQCPTGGILPVVPPQDCDHADPGPPGPIIPLPCVDELRPGYKRAWLNNRDLSGLLLPVRIYRHGVDGLAMEQQWPE